MGQWARWRFVDHQAQGLCLPARWRLSEPSQRPRARSVREQIARRVSPARSNLAQETVNRMAGGTERHRVSRAGCSPFAAALRRQAEGQYAITAGSTK